MLLRVGEARTTGINLFLAAVLSSVAGALNAVGFLAAGSFTANMTGNLSAFADHLAFGRIAAALSFAGLVLAFVSGAVAAALWIRGAERRGQRAVYAQAVFAEGLCLSGLAVWLVVRASSLSEPGLIVALSFVMGFQNAVSTLISNARVRTTHVSGMATDLGIEIAACLGPPQERRAALQPLKLHGLTLFCFAAGGIGGALIYGFSTAALMGICSLCLLGLAVPEMIRARRAGRG